MVLKTCLVTVVVLLCEATLLYAMVNLLFETCETRLLELAILMSCWVMAVSIALLLSHAKVLPMIPRSLILM